MYKSIRKFKSCRSDFYFIKLRKFRVSALLQHVKLRLFLPLVYRANAVVTTIYRLVNKGFYIIKQNFYLKNLLYKLTQNVIIATINEELI